MRLRNFIARLNWRQILLHFIATWCFIYSFQTLAYLYDSQLVALMRQSGGELRRDVLLANGIEGSRITYFAVCLIIAPLVGLFLGLITSLFVSIRSKWFLANSIVVFIIAFVLHNYDLLGWRYLKNVFLPFGHIFTDIEAEFLTNGILLMLIGVLIFYSKAATSFIENQAGAAK